MRWHARVSVPCSGGRVRRVTSWAIRLDDPRPLVSSVRSHAHAQLIFELHKAAPSLLLRTLPNIAERLREDDFDRVKVRRCRRAVLSEYAKNMHRHHCSSPLLTMREPRREAPPAAPRRETASITRTEAGPKAPCHPDMLRCRMPRVRVPCFAVVLRRAPGCDRALGQARLLSPRGLRL